MRQFSNTLTNVYTLRWTKPYFMAEKALIAIVVLGLRGNMRLWSSLTLSLGSFGMVGVTRPVR